MFAMRLPTVTLVHRRTGERRILNYHDYIRQLGKFMTGWKLVAQDDVGVKDIAVKHHLAEEAGERARFEKPGHISRSDERRRFEGRAITVGGETAATFRAQVAGEMARMSKEPTSST